VEDSHKREEAHTAGTEYHCGLRIFAAVHRLDGLLFSSLM
jgi:hypothetical protein